MTIDHELPKFVVDEGSIQHMDTRVERKTMMMTMIVSDKGYSFNRFFSRDIDDFDPTTMDDTVELDPKMGTKKRLKMEAKAEKQRQREVKKDSFRNKVLKSVFVARRN